MQIGDILNFRDDITDQEVFDAGLYRENIHSSPVKVIDLVEDEYQDQLTQWVLIEDCIFAYPISFFK